MLKAMKYIIVHVFVRLYELTNYKNANDILVNLIHNSYQLLCDFLPSQTFELLSFLGTFMPSKHDPTKEIKSLHQINEKNKITRNFV